MRLDKGWTQQDLAELCDVSVRTVQRVEKDGIASLETTLALASVFEVDKAIFLETDPIKPVGFGVPRRLVPLLIATLTVGFVFGLSVGFLI
ncbi:MAG: helix-turn-helix transcriptional regulator [Pseudomonadota bacterium]